MARADFRLIEGVPCLAFRNDGGMITWQDWMGDSLVVMLRKDPGISPSLLLMSFLNGAPLCSLPASPEIIQSIADSECHVLVSDDLGDELRLEGILVKNEPCDLSGYLYEGIKAQTRGDLNAAVEAYGNAKKESPQLPRIANLQGLCLRILEKYSEAESAYLEEINISPRLPDAYYNLGVLYMKTGRPQMARGMFEKSLDRDQFYLNGLVQLVKLLISTGERRSRLVDLLNLRLLAIYSDIPQVQEHLLEMASQAGLPPHEYSRLLKSEAGILSDSPILVLMKRLESLRLNGALMASLRGYSHLLEKTAGNPSETFFMHWVAKRMEILSEHIPAFLTPSWEKTRNDLSARIGKMVKAMPARNEPTHTPRTGAMGEPLESSSLQTKDGPLTSEEFFELTLMEILRDGIIKPLEAQMIFRLKNALRINEKTHQQIFSKIQGQAKANPQIDDGGDFKPLRLFTQLVKAVARDGKAESDEKNLLIIAGEALEILPEEMEKIFYEITR